MVTLTEAAGSQLAQILSGASEASEDSAVRIVQQGEELSLTLDTPREGDESCEYQGQKVLLLDQQIAGLLADKKLNVQNTEQGPQLTIESEQ